MSNTPNNLTDTFRNVELDSMVNMLQAQQDRRADYVVPAGEIVARSGRITIPARGLDLGPTSVMLGTMAPKDRLDLPTRHLREWHAGSADPSVSIAETAAFDAMVNARLVKASAQGRSFMVRSFTAGPDDGGIGVGRALLSDRFKIIDNFDTLMASLSGIEAAGVPVEIQGCDLTETRMRVRFFSPAVQYIATEWLKGYRNPFGHTDVDPSAHSGYATGQEPIVWAGFELSNSETGGGSFTICPRFVVKICRNGAKITKDAVKEIHLGGRLDHGQIDFRADTQEKAIELVRLTARDAVAQFLNPEYLETTIRDLEAKSAAEVPGEKAPAVIEEVAKVQRWSDEESKSILGRFIAGGQLTAGGVMQAVNAAAQGVAVPERAAGLEDQAIEAMECAAKLVAV